MRRLILFLTSLLLSSTLLWAADQQPDEVYVNNVTEFIHALRSNRTIVLADQLEFDDLLERINKFNPSELPEDDKYDEDRLASKQDYRFIYQNTDGYELILAGYQNLTIKTGIYAGSRALMRIRPRYAYVLTFVSCSNICLEGLVMGHTDEGYCDGGVVCFRNSHDIVIRNCDLYGCGTEGIGCMNVERLVMENSKIRDCTYQIMTLRESREIQFKRCFFFRNREYSLLDLFTCQDIQFADCVFSHNQGVLFNVHDSESILFERCDVVHSLENMGFYGDVTFKQCTFSDAFGVK